MLSNSMSFVEVREIFSAVGLVATEESAEILQRALRACDVDGDGRVDFGELTQLLSGDSLRAAFPDIEGYVRCVFRGLDADGDGILSMAELRRMFYAMGYQPEDAGGFGDLARGMDEDGSGGIDVGELGRFMARRGSRPMDLFLFTQQARHLVPGGPLISGSRLRALDRLAGPDPPIDATRAVAVVVLGKKLSAEGLPTAILRGRMVRALEVAAELGATAMVLTGGKVGGGGSEAAVMAFLVAGLVPEGTAVVIEDAAQTTIENAFLVRAALERLGTTQVALVTSDFHMNRAAEIFDHVLGLDLTDADVRGLVAVCGPAVADIGRGRAPAYTIARFPDRPGLGAEDLDRERAFEALVWPHVPRDTSLVVSGTKVLRCFKP